MFHQNRRRNHHEVDSYDHYKRQRYDDSHFHQEFYQPPPQHHYQQFSNNNHMFFHQQQPIYHQQQPIHFTYNQQQPQFNNNNMQVEPQQQIPYIQPIQQPPPIIIAMNQNRDFIEKKKLVLKGIQKLLDDNKIMNRLKTQYDLCFNMLENGTESKVTIIQHMSELSKEVLKIINNEFNLVNTSPHLKSLRKALDNIKLYLERTKNITLNAQIESIDKSLNADVDCIDREFSELITHVIKFELDHSEIEELQKLLKDLTLRQLYYPLDDDPNLFRCSTCGLRFNELKDKQRIEVHLDVHFEEKKYDELLKQSINKPFECIKGWFDSEDDWGKAQMTVSQHSNYLNRTAVKTYWGRKKAFNNDVKLKQEEEREEKFKKEEIPKMIVVRAEHIDVLTKEQCPHCKERLVSVRDLEEDVYYFNNCVYIENVQNQYPQLITRITNKTYCHSFCIDDLIRQESHNVLSKQEIV